MYKYTKRIDSRARKEKKRGVLCLSVREFDFGQGIQ